MSLSTTSTTTYALAKYSRAYPSQNSTAREADVEWQHYTNPVIRLALDIKKSAQGELESYRVRIIWSLNAGQSAMDIDHRDVMFEDLELLSFSTTAKQSFASHGLPLKAVYRDAVVGVRYLHPLHAQPGLPASYRRFQMNFSKASDATGFIESIRHVCPCKANPPAQPTLARATTLASGLIVPSGTSGATQASKMPPPPAPATEPSMRPLRSAVTVQTVQRQPSLESPQRPLSSSRMSISSLVDDDASVSASNVILPAKETLQSGDITGASVRRLAAASAHQDSASSFQRSPLERLATSSTHNQIINTVGTKEADSAYTHIADQSDLTSALHATTTGDASAVARLPIARGSPPPKELPSNEDVQMDGSTPSTVPLLKSPPELPGLHELSPEELERLVAEVVREEGFVKLLESLDTMWRVKMLLGR